MAKIWGIVGLLALGGFFLLKGSEVRIFPAAPPSPEPLAQSNLAAIDLGKEVVAAEASSTEPVYKGNGDIEKQLALLDPPAEVRGIYVTNWSAGSSRMKNLIELIEKTELNAIVIDIKDYSGFLAYGTDVPDVKAAGAEAQIRIRQPNALIKELHEKGIYVIGRIAVFQDGILAKAYPEWALKNKNTGEMWTDRKGLAWLDPSIPEVWDYNIAIAKDALSRGFDEINFDYIRFASDGDLSAIGYPEWDSQVSKAAVMRSFFKYLREKLSGAKISADFFGLATIQRDDLGIGQIIESAYQYFDFVAPMVYPSHYATGFLGYKNPGAYPYEIVKYSLDTALARLIAYQEFQTSTVSSTTQDAGGMLAPNLSVKLRPWLQDFDIGAVYDAPMVRKQIQAVYDSLLSGSSTHAYNGWLLWDPSNVYTRDALDPAQ